MKKILCIYHGNCADGFAAAWVFRRELGEDAVEFFPATHGKPGPDVDYCRGRRVIMVDFCYPLDTMCRIYAESVSLVVLDHHATALPILQELEKVAAGDPGFYYDFDLNQSGAGLAWNYFHSSEPMPRLLRHIQDRDLWRFALDDTKEISAALYSHPYDFDVWDKIIADFDDPDDYRYWGLRGVFVKEGAAIIRKQAKDIAELLPVLTQIWTIAGEPVPMANLPYTYSSEAGHALLQAHPHAAFAGTYYDREDGRRVVSFRSEDSRADVGAIAKRLGGGGHRNASGATMPPEWRGDAASPADAHTRAPATPLAEAMRAYRENPTAETRATRDRVRAALAAGPADAAERGGS